MCLCMYVCPCAHAHIYRNDFLFSQSPSRGPKLLYSVISTHTSQIVGSLKLTDSLPIKRTFLLNPFYLSGAKRWQVAPVRIHTLVPRGYTLGRAETHGSFELGKDACQLGPLKINQTAHKISRGLTWT